jgi:hypothetical protein
MSTTPQLDKLINDRTSELQATKSKIEAGQVAQNRLAGLSAARDELVAVQAVFTSSAAAITNRVVAARAAAKRVLADYGPQSKMVDDLVKDKGPDLLKVMDAGLGLEPHPAWKYAEYLKAKEDADAKVSKATQDLANAQRAVKEQRQEVDARVAAIERYLASVETQVEQARTLSVQVGQRARLQDAVGAWWTRKQVEALDNAVQGADAAKLLSALGTACEAYAGAVSSAAQADSQLSQAIAKQTEAADALATATKVLLTKLAAVLGTS